MKRRRQTQNQQDERKAKVKRRRNRRTRIPPAPKPPLRPLTVRLERHEQVNVTPAVECLLEAALPPKELRQLVSSFLSPVVLVTVLGRFRDMETERCWPVLLEEEEEEGNLDIHAEKEKKDENDIKAPWYNSDVKLPRGLITVGMFSFASHHWRVILRRVSSRVYYIRVWEKFFDSATKSWSARYYPEYSFRTIPKTKTSHDTGWVGYASSAGVRCAAVGIQHTGACVIVVVDSCNGHCHWFDSRQGRWRRESNYEGRLLVTEKWKSANPENIWDWSIALSAENLFIFLGNIVLVKNYYSVGDLLLGDWKASFFKIKNFQEQYSVVIQRKKEDTDADSTSVLAFLVPYTSDRSISTSAAELKLTHRRCETGPLNGASFVECVAGDFMFQLPNRRIAILSICKPHVLTAIPLATCLHCGAKEEFDLYRTPIPVSHPVDWYQVQKTQLQGVFACLA